MSISQLAFIALANTPGDPEIGTVVFTGVTIVFFVLILLYVIITIEGVIFTGIENKKKQTTEQVNNDVQEVKPVVKIDKKEQKAVDIKDGIPNEVVAAISAAITCMQEIDGTTYTISSVAKARAPKRNAWANSAAIAYTEPF